MYWFYIEPHIMNNAFYLGAKPYIHRRFANEYFILLLLKVLKKNDSLHFSKIKALESDMLRSFVEFWHSRILLDEAIKSLKNNSKALSLLNNSKLSLSSLKQSDAIIQLTALDIDDKQLFDRLDKFIDDLSIQFRQELTKR